MRSGTGAAGLVRRQLVADRGIGLVVVLVVLVVAGLVAVWPRAIEEIFTRDFHETVESEPVRTRDLVSVRTSSNFAGLQLLGPEEHDDSASVPADAVYGEFDATLEQARSELAEPLRSALGGADYVLSGPDLTFGARADYWPSDVLAGRLTLTADPAFADRIELTSGTLPGPAESSELDPADVFGEPIAVEERPGPDGESEQIRIFDTGMGGPVSQQAAFGPDQTVRSLTLDAVLTAATADRFAWEIDEVREIAPGVSVRLSGTFEPRDPADGYWEHHRSILEPFDEVHPIQGTITVLGQAFVDPVAFGALTGGSELSLGPMGVTMRVWYPVDPGDLRIASAAGMAGGLRAFLAEPPTVTGPGTDQAHAYLTSLFGHPSDELTLGFTTNTADVIDRTLGAQSAAAALIAMVVAGPLGATIAVLALALKLLVERRRTALALVEARGASVRQLRVAVAIEGLLLGLPAAAGAALLVDRFVPGNGGVAGWVLPAVIGLAPLILLPTLLRPASLLAQRRDLGRRHRGWVRWTVDVLVVGVAAMALWLLDRRGLAAGTTTGGVDPLLAATPLLLALAACVVVLRIYPIPVALIARLSRGRRGLVGYVGAARAVRDPAGGLAAVLALVVGLTVGVLSTVLWATTLDATSETAEDAIGANIRASGPQFTSEDVAAVEAIPGVTAVAGVASFANQTLSGGRINEAVEVLVADPDALSRVQDGLANAPSLPDELSEASGSGASGSDVPVVVSSGIGEVGDTRVLQTAQRPQVRIAAQAESIPGVTSRSWILVADDVFAERVGTGAPPLPRTLLIATTADEDAVAAEIASVLPVSAQLRTQQGVVDDIAGGAIGSGLRAGFTIAAAVGGAFAAAAVIMTMVIAAPSRGRLFSQLRTLGLSSRQARGLATWELAPLAVTAVVVGSLLGLVIPWLLLPSVDLGALTGGSSQPGMSVDWMLAGGAVSAFVVVALLAMTVAVAFSRRLRLGTVLRVGEEV